VAKPRTHASWQARTASWLLRHTLKRRLVRARDIAEVRRLFTPPRYRVKGDVTITPATVGGVPGEWIVPRAAAGDTLLYIHGGGYFACSIETHRAITVGFARLGFRVFAPEYRLAPEHVFPAPLEDVTAVYRALLDQAVVPERLAVAGDSAGGGLAVALMVSMREAGAPLPAAAALFSPWTDLAGTGESLRTNDSRCAMFHGRSVSEEPRRYFGSFDPRNPLVSPLYADLKGLPPLLIHVGEDEVLRDDSTRLAERARAAGVPVVLRIWPAVPHVWQLLQTTVPEARESLAEAAGFLHAATAAGAPVA
jgi:acetyl esterase/lipase